LKDYQQENLASVYSAGKHLLELINEVLNLSEIESGNFKFSIEPIDILPIVDNVISISRPAAIINGISIEYQKIPENSIFIEADAIRFKQVVLNLVSNAIKYNKENGSVIISYDQLENGKTRLGVRDTGIGIPDEKVEQIFKPFERLGLEAGGIEGTGIGLTISKKLIEMMNGTIGFSSIPDEGSFFYVDIPTSLHTPRPIQVENQPSLIQPTLNQSKEKKILCIDDIAINVNLVKRIIFHYPNLNFLSASNAFEGIEIAKTQIPDLILMDIHMPDMDGLTAFKELKLIEETKEIPIIALSADAMDKSIKKALDMGFNDYITKPIDLKKLLSSIGKIIS